MPGPAFDRIVALLDAHGVDYRHIRHAPAKTSEEAALRRGESMSIGGKSLVFKADRGFVLLVISADRQVRSSRARRAFGSSRLRFASGSELFELTEGLVPGSVPPFGEPVLSVPLYVDRSVLENERIAFTPGTLTDSIVMRTSDWRSVVTMCAVVDVAR